MKKPTLSDKAAVAMILVPLLGSTTSVPVFASEPSRAPRRGEPGESKSALPDRDQDRSSSADSKSTELRQAFDEFKAAAERLGKSLARNADENTAEARQQILKTMTGAVHELSKSMDQASRRLEARKQDQRQGKPEPRPSP